MCSHHSHHLAKSVVSIIDPLPLVSRTITADNLSELRPSCFITAQPFRNLRKSVDKGARKGHAFVLASHVHVRPVAVWLSIFVHSSCEIYSCLWAPVWIRIFLTMASIMRSESLRMEKAMIRRHRSELNHLRTLCAKRQRSAVATAHKLSSERHVQRVIFVRMRFTTGKCEESEMRERWRTSANPR
jgi:hypothetical protein